VISLSEIRERTYKRRDAWWTVLLVDPLAVRLVRIVAPHRRITPNRLTLAAGLLGLAAAACFAGQTRWWLVAGALLFHTSFVVDCMDGKVARLNGTGTMFGQWLDFALDRIKAAVCALALFGGQYLYTGRLVYVWLLGAVTFLDLFRYVNGGQIARSKAAMRQGIDELTSAGRPDTASDPGTASHPGTASDPGTAGHPGTASDPNPPSDPGDGPKTSASLKRRAGGFLREHRIRTHLFSGIEYEMTIFILAPLTGWIIPVTVAAAALLLIFEAWLVVKLWRQTRVFAARVERAKRDVAALRAGARGDAYAKHPN
jgi:hypothetical protein